jgi:hypothetical protein
MGRSASGTADGPSSVAVTCTYVLPFLFLFCVLLLLLLSIGRVSKGRSWWGGRLMRAVVC